jgi:hypothetical protein
MRTVIPSIFTPNEKPWSPVVMRFHRMVAPWLFEAIFCAWDSTKSFGSSSHAAR